MYCQHDRDMHDITFFGFIANECSALRPELKNNHGPSQLKGSRSPGFWFPAKCILSGTWYVHMYVGSSTIIIPFLPTIHIQNSGSVFFPYKTHKQKIDSLVVVTRNLSLNFTVFSTHTHLFSQSSSSSTKRQ